MSTGCKSSHSSFLDVSRSNCGLGISGWICQLLYLTIFSTVLSVAAFRRRAGGSVLESTGSHGRGVERRVPEMRQTDTGIDRRRDRQTPGQTDAGIDRHRRRDRQTQTPGQTDAGTDRHRDRHGENSAPAAGYSVHSLQECKNKLCSFVGNTNEYATRSVIRLTL